MKKIWNTKRLITLVATLSISGSFDFAGNSYQVEITKVYPVIANGQFQVDMDFTGAMPTGIRRGQRVRVRLELGDTSEAVLMARGGFFQTTGGGWVYKLSDDGTTAYRKEIRLGQQNPEFFEVLNGLQAGDQVIISNYDTFGDNEILQLN